MKKSVLYTSGIIASTALLVGCGTNTTTGSPSNTGHKLQAGHNGGTMTVTFRHNPQTIDPRKIYNAEDWNIGRALYMGLYSTDENLHLQPSVASGPPQISSNGTVYTIHLKKDMKWSNGQPVTAEDFVYALKTELSSKTQSPDLYLWYMIKGATAYEAGKSDMLGVKALGKYTIQYTLSQPYTAFPYVLTTPAAFPVYKGGAKAIDKSPVTDGAYVVESWKTGVQMVLSKNPQYGQHHPYPSHIVFDFNVDPSVGVLRVQSGQADLVGDGIPSANYLKLEGNSAFAPNITRGYIPAVELLALNEKVKPFNNIKVRQAIQLAVNKRHLLKLLNGRGRVANHILPVSLPGLSALKASNPYPYNPTKAKRLLAQAGYPDGFTTTLGLSSEQTGASEIALELQSDLKAVGIQLHIKPLPPDAPSIAKIPMTTYSWNMDFPDPSDFIDGFITSPPVVGGSNPAFLHDPTLDKMGAKADAMRAGRNRINEYMKIDARAMQDAAYVPLVYPEMTYYHSSRVVGFNKIPAYFPVIYSDISLSKQS